MNVTKTTLGGLACQTVDLLPQGSQPRLAVILCHGFVAPGTDLVPLAPELLSAERNLGDAVRFYFPAAPLSLEEMGMYGGRAWWHIDMNRLVMAAELGRTLEMRQEIPDGLPHARMMLLAMIDELQQQTGLPTNRIVLGGFSQGSMLATDVALRLDDAPAGLCIYSGTLICETEWRELAAQRGPLPVLQSHGRQDPLLPFSAAEMLRDLLSGAGMPVEFLSFSGGHTISAQSVERFAAMISRLAAE